MEARDNIVVIGDLNLSTISWLHSSNNFRFPDYSRSSIRPASFALLDAYSTARLRQVNGVLNTNNRLLDLCFISKDLGQNCSLLRAPAPLVKFCRHHPPLLLTLELHPGHRFKEIAETNHYDFNRVNFVGMNNFPAGVDWNTSLACDDASSVASTVCNVLLYAIDQFVSKKRHRKPANPIWSNSVLKHLKRIKRAALRKFSKHRTDAAKAENLRANAAYKRLNATLYKNYQCDLQNRPKSNPKKFWSYVNKQRKESGLPSNITNGTIEVDTVESIAELFRTKFCSVFSEENLNAQDVANATSNIQTMRLFGSSFTINRDMVIEAGNQLKTSIGSGPDGIPSLILKRCLKFLAAPLAMFFNLSLTTGVFPECIH
ncbi:uncharacterized protein LOC129720238 [Wyeomyia smithii]|uniref:uncharacterized protein LOC129720238 n=1 Tax=Wyeomyia smithii TaxID=174621 RepID=UPI002468093F|nr:uncharacterized protein LOC129720238 [Wyeomyia smithii]